MKTDRNYLIGVSFALAFVDKKVTVVKALRCLFDLSLKEAKEMADDYVCLESRVCGAISCDLTFRCTAAQTAWAMCALQTGDPDNYANAYSVESDSKVNTAVFTFRWIEAASDSGVLNVAMYDRRAL